MATFQPADTLRSRTFLGLLVAQFLAAFNDQAIHASSMFFAINQNALSERIAIALMPILFYAPWALFCTLAGYLADRYSKWNSLVFWKVAEVIITLVALLGFWLGTHGSPVGPYVVLSTVFLMGTHSAFFVPAKYGAMPEILQPHMLSRGNGLLESLSFLAVILGTVVGGMLSQAFRGEEWKIGLVLTGLAVAGALASLLMRRMPAANPTRPFPPYLYRPLWDNIRTLLRSRPLALAVIGIAFFTFIVAFMRSTMYMHGETRLPRWEEGETSEVVGMVALGIGLGSPLVGFLSGRKVELGLVPVGAVGMIAATLVAAMTLDHRPWLITCIIFIGFFTGFYIVPLFTLLQHRAPKTSKGDSIATSNFINVTGAIISSVLFFLLGEAAHLSGVTPALKQVDRIGELVEDPVYKKGRPVRVVIAEPGAPPRVIQVSKEAAPVRYPREIDVDEGLIDVFGTGLKKGDRVVESVYHLGGVKHHRIRREDQPLRPVYNESGLPRLLFVGAALMTLLTLLLLWGQMPDLFLRTFLWAWATRRFRLEITGLNNLPGNGPVLLVTNAPGVEGCLQVLTATDRTTRFLLAEEEEPCPVPWLLRTLAGWSALARLRAGATESDWRRAGERADRLLRRKGVVGLSLGGEAGARAERLFETITAQRPVPVLPVYRDTAPAPSRRRRQRVYIVAGDLLPAGSTPEAVRLEFERLAADLRQRPHGAAVKPVYSESH
jgi:MFS family permease